MRETCPAPIRPSNVLTLLNLCIATAISASAMADTPEYMLRRFYLHVQSGACQHAIALAPGYFIAQCLRDSKHAKLQEPIIKETALDSSSTLTFSLSSSNDQPPSTTTEDYSLRLLPRNPLWIIDYASLRKISKSSPDLFGANPPHPATAKPEPKPTAPPHEKPPVGLLSLWTPEQLAGQDSDKLIHTQAPDHSPPERTAPQSVLPPLKPTHANAIRRVNLPSGQKKIAVTFDLCEQADEVTGYDRAIVNLLRQRGIAATFFAGGKWMRSHPDKTQQLMADPLFELGNHGWTHGNLHKMTGEKMRQQIVWTQAEYERLREKLQQEAERRGLGRALDGIPPQPLVMRFPYAVCSAESLQAVNGLGIAAIQMDVLSGDPAPRQSADTLARAVIGGVRPGSIIIFHANGRGHSTAQALPRILDQLQKDGYEFVTVSKLLAAGQPVAGPECYWLKPGDAADYIDRHFGEGTETHGKSRRQALAHTRQR